MNSEELEYLQEFIRFLDYIDKTYPFCNEHIRKICNEMSKMIDKFGFYERLINEKLCPKCKSKLSIKNCGEVPAFNDVDIMKGYSSDDISSLYTLYMNKIEYICDNCGYMSIVWNPLSTEK